MDIVENLWKKVVFWKMGGEYGAKNWKPIEWCLKKFQRIRSKMSAGAKNGKESGIDRGRWNLL